MCALINLHLELQKDAGFDYWAISTGNEPLNGDILGYYVPFMSLGWTAKHQVILCNCYYIEP